MRNYLTFFFIICLCLPVFAVTEHNGDWIIHSSSSEECDFVGNGKLNANYKTLKLKATQWKWKETSNFTKKTFKGKFKKNYIDLSIKAKEVGSKHVLKGSVKDNKITLTFLFT